MQMTTPPRNTIRLTRRGRIALVVTGAVVAGTAVAVPLLGLGGGGGRPASLVVRAGLRASEIYEAVDKALDLPPGTTRKSLLKADLGLPADAGGNPEGYLFPATYPLDEKTTPRRLLRTMARTAHEKFNGAPIAAGAQRNAMNVYQAVTIASIVQAEAATKADMGRIARVVFNRLERGMPLQMDSTVTYALGRTPARASVKDTRLDSPYNSYQRMGLPPTPVGNPGEAAMRAAVNPAPGNWLYFVTVGPGDTRFTADFAEHRRNLAERDRRQGAGRKETSRDTDRKPGRSPDRNAGRPPAGRPAAGPAGRPAAGQIRRPVSGPARGRAATPADRNPPERRHEQCRRYERCERHERCRRYEGRRGSARRRRAGRLRVPVGGVFGASCQAGVGTGSPAKSRPMSRTAARPAPIVLADGP